MIKEGQKLPSFKLKNQKDEEVKFPTKEDTVIYFYPKADTPGCTKESCDFQSNLRKSQDSFVQPGVSALG